MSQYFGMVLRIGENDVLRGRSNQWDSPRLTRENSDTAATIQVSLL